VQTIIVASVLACFMVHSLVRSTAFRRLYRASSA
jgi:hypothetical protein